MSSAETGNAPVARAITLLELPKFDDLTESQTRGFTCVWDSGEEPLAEEDSVDLGPRRTGRLDGEYGWHPRGCPQHVAGAAYEALFIHCLGPCEACGPTEETVVDGVASGRRCEIADSLRRLVLRKGRL